MRGRFLTPSPVLPREATQLGGCERSRLAAEILWSYVLVRWWMLRTDLPQTLSATRRVARAGADGELSDTTMLRLGQAVQRTLGALPLDSRCLIRSLVLTRVLARRGMTSTVVFAARSKPSFAAHSWVEHAGVPLLPTGTGFYRLTEM